VAETVVTIVVPASLAEIVEETGAETAVAIEAETGAAADAVVDLDAVAADPADLLRGSNRIVVAGATFRRPSTPRHPVIGTIAADMTIAARMTVDRSAGQIVAPSAGSIGVQRHLRSHVRMTLFCQASL
jgi:hypothetical protein